MAGSPCAALTHVDVTDGVVMERVDAVWVTEATDPHLTARDVWPWANRPTCALLHSDDAIQDEVREPQEQVGNSIAVVLGWLRLPATPSTNATFETGPPGGIQVAIRRLEEAQASIAEPLRRAASTALRAHADDASNASEVCRTVGRVGGEPPDVRVRAHGRRLARFPSQAEEMLSPRALLPDDACIVPCACNGLVTASSLSAPITL